jgi:predicted GNAT family acetyltransferase
MSAAVTDNTDQERFEVTQDGVLAGFAQYRRQGRLIAFIHTEVDRDFEGQGLGTQLIKGALDSARSE